MLREIRVIYYLTGSMSQLAQSRLLQPYLPTAPHLAGHLRHTVAAHLGQVRGQNNSACVCATQVLEPAWVDSINWAHTPRSRVRHPRLQASQQVVNASRNKVKRDPHSRCALGAAEGLAGTACLEGGLAELAGDTGALCRYQKGGQAPLSALSAQEVHRPAPCQ